MMFSYIHCFHFSFRERIATTALWDGFLRHVPTAKFTKKSKLGEETNNIHINDHVMCITDIDNETPINFTKHVPEFVHQSIMMKYESL